MPRYLHPDLRPILGPTHGVVVFHEQVIEMIAPVRRLRPTPRPTRPGARSATSRGWRTPSCGSSRGRSAAATRPAVVEEIWKVLEAFASFGFCKAHAAAFALPTYQSAWLKAHYPAHFLSGVLTHDPGMYPKRLILDDARQLGIAVLGLDVNASREDLRRGAGRRRTTSRRREVLGAGPASRAGPGPARRPRLRHPAGAGGGQGHLRGRGGPDRGGPALPLAHRLLAPRPGVPAGGSSGWCSRAGSTASTASARRCRASRPPRRGVTRRDLLLQVADLDRHARAVDRARRAGARPGAGVRCRAGGEPRRTPTPAPAARRRPAAASERRGPAPTVERRTAPGRQRRGVGAGAGQSQATRRPPR